MAEGNGLKKPTPPCPDIPPQKAFTAFRAPGNADGTAQGNDMYVTKNKMVLWEEPSADHYTDLRKEKKRGVGNEGRFCRRVWGE